MLTSHRQNAKVAIRTDGVRVKTGHPILSVLTIPLSVATLGHLIVVGAH